MIYIFGKKWLFKNQNGERQFKKLNHSEAIPRLTDALKYK
jgi:hypothetical protein